MKNKVSKNCLYKRISFLKAICIILALFLMCFLFVPSKAKEGEWDEEDLGEVLTKSNMRDAASKEGAIVTKIPEGAVLVIVSDNGSDFLKVKYGKDEGYIFRGCVSVKHEHTISEYNDQFDDVNLNITVTNSKSAHAGVIVSSLPYRPDNLKEYVPGDQNWMGDYADEIIKSDNDVPSSKSSTSLMHVGLSSNGTGDNNVSSYTSYQTTGKVTTDLRLREGPSTSTSKITTIPSGATIKVIDEGKDGFYHVEYDGKEGYAYSSCVKCEEKPVSSAPSQSTGNNNLAGGSSGTGFLATGVRRNNVNSGNNKAETIEVQAVSSADTNSKLTANRSYEITARANMRSLPSQQSDKLTTLPVGSEVIALGRTKDGYTLVQYNGVQGYVLEDLVSSGVNVQINTDTAMLFTITAYCPCQKCCGNFSPEVTGAAEPHTSTGTVPMQGRTVAVDPGVIPYGTKLSIEGLGSFVAEDCGGSVDGTHIDLYFDNHEDAKNFGVKRLYVTFE